MNGNIYPIDIVYTWVDSSDPEWIKQKNLYPDFTFEEGRFPPVNAPDIELETSLLLLFKFMPFVNNVYIVTADRQVPPCIFKNTILRTKPINVVHHSEIWPKNMLHTLPTFNSHAIEANLHRIPNLSELFIYFNDDVHVVKPIMEHDCFVNNKAVVQRMGRFKPFYSTSKHNDVWIKLMTDYNPINTPWHGFHCLNKSVIMQSEHIAGEDWVRTIRSRIRNGNDMPTIGFSINYALLNNFAYRATRRLRLFTTHNVYNQYNYSNKYHVVCINHSNNLLRDATELRKHLNVFSNINEIYSISSIRPINHIESNHIE
jgi:hypothetical protein